MDSGQYWMVSRRVCVCEIQPNRCPCTSAIYYYLIKHVRLWPMSEYLLLFSYTELAMKWQLTVSNKRINDIWKKALLWLLHVGEIMYPSPYKVFNLRLNQIKFWKELEKQFKKINFTVYGKVFLCKPDNYWQPLPRPENCSDTILTLTIVANGGT